jgi:hypothetical protein
MQKILTIPRINNKGFLVHYQNGLTLPPIYRGILGSSTRLKTTYPLLAMLKPKYRTKVPIFELNLSSPSGLISASLSRIFDLAISCAPGYVLRFNFFTWLVLVLLLVSLAMFYVALATDFFAFLKLSGSRVPLFPVLHDRPPWEFQPLLFSQK